MKIKILGATGLLGHNLVNYFSSIGWKVIAYCRNIDKLKRHYIDRSNIEYREFNKIWVDDIYETEFIINAVGITSQNLKETNNNLEAIQINSLLPYALSKSFAEFGIKIINIATDGVFSGKGIGTYTEYYHEHCIHNADDVYGKTKSLGEVCNNNFYNLRCSIIGRELETKNSLVEWFLNQAKQKELITGYNNHFWNGITALQFGKICKNLIENNLSPRSGTFHIVPKASITKYGLLSYLNQYYQTKANIFCSGTLDTINRTLTTNYPEVNRLLWANNILSIEEMIKEMVTFK